jgi:energy-coupling factor transporter ATP-binding protein EcfA2
MGDCAAVGTTSSFAVRVAAATAKAAPGIDWDRIGVYAGIVAAIAAVIALFPMTRNAVGWVWRGLQMRAGLPYRAYARKFVERHRSYSNPYLDRRENLDLRSTYVPLSFQAGDAQDLTLASSVLAGLSSDRLVIVGDPGSGKSTLLKAYGVGALQGRHVLTRRRRVVPYLVQLRVLARYLGPDTGLADYIVNEVLVKGGFFKDDRAREFFRHTLLRRQAVVLLDGLDEVPDALQPEVLAAVLAFTRDQSLERPAARSAVLLTCRAQNFRSLRENWVPAFASAERLYTLAPFRDFEIMNYLLRFPDKFRTEDGPSRFMKAARDAKTLDLLRAPLVLAMAVGSYAHRPAELPATIAELYENMIREMLDRNSFRREDPENSVLRYRVSDKYRFLRQFALYAAEKTGEFGEFTRQDLDDYATVLEDQLSAVDSPPALVTEIIQRSSLLSDVGDDDEDRLLFVFAHRSIQEFLAAQELRMPGRDGSVFLLGQAFRLTWRQVILFYTAGQEPQLVDGFLSELARRDSDLAAYCLQGAMPSDGAAAEVLDALKPVTPERLGALAAATRSPRQRVQQMAISQLKSFIADSVDALSAGGAGIEAMMPLLESLAVTNAAEIAALVPQVIRNLPDDPRLIGPLWACLSADGIELHPAECAEIVQRLLTLTMESGAFAELGRQQRHQPYFLERLRSRAYPFRNGLTMDHNQVTLLAWAEYLGVTPVNPNRYFEARAAGHLGRVELARRRTVSFSLCWPTRVVSALLFLAAWGVAIYVGVERPHLLMTPFGWKTLLLVFLGGTLGGIFVMALVVTPLEARKNDSTIHRFRLPPAENDADVFGIGSGNLFALPKQGLQRIHVDLTGLEGLPAISLLLAAPIAAAPLLKISVTEYLLVALGAPVIFLLTNLNAFGKEVRYYLYRPSDFVDMYDDPRSRQWLGLAWPSHRDAGDGGAPPSADVAQPTANAGPQSAPPAG